MGWCPSEGHAFSTELESRHKDTFLFLFLLSEKKKLTLGLDRFEDIWASRWNICPQVSVREAAQASSSEHNHLEKWISKSFSFHTF